MQFKRSPRRAGEQARSETLSSDKRGENRSNPSNSINNPGLFGADWYGGCAGANQKRQFILLSLVTNYFKDREMLIVVKRHPYCKSVEVEEMLVRFVEEKKVVLVNGSIHALIASADAMITVNSGVGLEALMHEKIVISTGTSEYSKVTRECKTRDELVGALGKLLTSPGSRQEIRRSWAFLHYLRANFLFSPIYHRALEKRITRWLVERS